MPYRFPGPPTQQAAYNGQLQQSFAATRRVPPYVPASDASVPVVPGRDPIADLKELGQLHADGVLTDAEFATAKAKVLGAEANTS
jgi:hypothetical protein